VPAFGLILVLIALWLIVRTARGKLAATLMGTG
jgi:hypothetical protein